MVGMVIIVMVQVIMAVMHIKMMNMTMIAVVGILQKKCFKNKQMELANFSLPVS